MPTTSHHVERLSLTFRAEQPAPARAVLPGGWWLWCLLGIGVGLGGWWLSRQYLAERLAAQLVDAKSRPEAMLAIEGLILLDSTASKEIVAGLQNEDFAVARTAFRAIASQIDRWQEFKLSESSARMLSLAQSLLELPESTPTDNLILASSLASRMFTICLDREDQSLQPTMQLCEEVIQRVGKQNSEATTIRVASSEGSAPTASGDNLHTEFTAGFPDPLALPPPPLESMGSQSLESAPKPEELENVPPATLLDDSAAPRNAGGNQPLSSTGGHASLRLVTSPGPRLSTKPTMHLLQNSLQSELPPAESSLDFNTQSESVAARPSSTDPSFERSVESEDEPSARKVAGIEHLPIQELVRLLGSVQPKIAQAAALSLRRKGMTDSKLELAMQLATGTEERRLEIIDGFPQRTDLDPRVWLLWMAQDGQPEVRGRAIAQLSSMLDHDVMRELRLLLNRERDPEIARTIRRLLISP